MGVEQNSPIRTPGVPNTAVDDATTRSHDAASWQPAAIAGPWTAAITGCGIDWTVSIISVQTSKISRSSSSVRPIISDRSWPAENTGPAADSTTTRTASSLPKPWSAAVTARIMLVDSGFRWPGRSRYRRATPVRPSKLVLIGSSMPHSSREYSQPDATTSRFPLQALFVPDGGHTPGRSAAGRIEGVSIANLTRSETAARSAAVTVRAYRVELDVSDAPDETEAGFLTTTTVEFDATTRRRGWTSSGSKCVR